MIEVVSASSFSTGRHGLLVAGASEHGDDIAWQGGRGPQSGHELIWAQRITAFCRNAGLQLLDNLVPALLELPVSARLPGPARLTTVPHRGIKPGRSFQPASFGSTIPGTCVRRAAEQGNCLPHRLKRPCSFAAQPVVPRHGVRVQLAQSLLALSRGRGSRRVSVGVRRSSAPRSRCLEQVRLG